MRMTLTEARKKFIGKKFRLTKDVPLHYEYDYGSGVPYAYIPAGLEGLLTAITSNSFVLEGKVITYFEWRIDIPNCNKKWFSTNEIEPVKEA